MAGIDGGGEGIILGPGRVLQDRIPRGYDDQVLFLGTLLQCNVWSHIADMLSRQDRLC